jgi:hypothetical protein
MAEVLCVGEAHRLRQLTEPQVLAFLAAHHEAC